ncbi:uncharacterized protein LOC144360018 [Saccoglossus kowalevskii]
MRIALIFISVLLVVRWKPSVQMRDYVLRPNYGVLFERVANIDNSLTYWHHTFAIPYLDIPMMSVNESLCSNETVHLIPKFCEEYGETLKLVEQQNKFYMYHISRDERAIRVLFPKIEKKNLGNERQKRGLLDFVGKVSKSLFGTATSNDVNILRRHVAALESSTEVMTDQIVAYEDDLNSYVFTTNKRIGNALNGIKENHEAIYSIVSDLSQWRKRLNRMELNQEALEKELNYERRSTHLMFRYAIQRLQALQLLERETQRRVSSIDVLLQERLPLQLVGPRVLGDALRAVRKKLRKKYPNFDIAYTNLNYYYHNARVTFRRTDNNVYIKVGIPLL